MTFFSDKQKAPADNIYKLAGVLSVTVARLSNSFSLSAGPNHDSYTIGDANLSDVQKAAIEMLDKNELESITVTLGDRRILVDRWRQTACAVTVPRASSVNKSVWRKIRRVGHKYDRRDPDDTLLGKALGELERSDPEVRRAADNYERVKQEIIDGKHA